MSNRNPAVSIGLPVYNGGEAFVRALESLLAQDHDNFELVISDNASTDQTESVARRAAETDTRIRYFRQPQVKETGWNLRFTLEQADAPYFMWAAHDDQWSPNMVSSLALTLDGEPNAVLAFPATHLVNLRGEVITDCGQLAELAGPHPLMQRLNNVLWFEPALQRGYLMYGLMRTAALRRIGELAGEKEVYGKWGGGQLTVFGMAFEGYFAFAPEALLYRSRSAEAKEDADDFIEHYRQIQAFYQHHRNVISASSLDDMSRDFLLTSLASRETTSLCRVMNAKNMNELRTRIGSIIEYCDEARTASGTASGSEVTVSTENTKTSIVILNYNGRRDIQACLESVRRYTNPPYEVLVFDNASTDTSREYLRTVPDITLVESPENLGCPPGRAKAIALARGDFVLFLDNDTVVTPGWLDRMLTHMLRHPEIGILGPRSNYVSGAQRVPAAAYQNQNEMVQFAKYWSWLARGEKSLVPAPRLVGFCMLIRRAVIDKIGGPDPQFGRFGFEDDDLALRAVVAGYQIKIANNVFIHHTGGPQGKGDAEYNRQLLAAWEVFKRKWELPFQLAYGQPYDVAEIRSRRFDPTKHVVAIPDAETVRPLVYEPQIPTGSPPPWQDSTRPHLFSSQPQP